MFKALLIAVFALSIVGCGDDSSVENEIRRQEARNNAKKESSATKSDSYGGSKNALVIENETRSIARPEGEGSDEADEQEDEELFSSEPEETDSFSDLVFSNINLGAQSNQELSDEDARAYLKKHKFVNGLMVNLRADPFSCWRDEQRGVKLVKDNGIELVQKREKQRCPNSDGEATKVDVDYLFRVVCDGERADNIGEMLKEARIKSAKELCPGGAGTMLMHYSATYWDKDNDNDVVRELQVIVGESANTGCRFEERENGVEWERGCIMRSQETREDDGPSKVTIKVEYDPMVEDVSAFPGGFQRGEVEVEMNGRAYDVDFDDGSMTID